MTRRLRALTAATLLILGMAGCASETETAPAADPGPVTARQAGSSAPSAGAGGEECSPNDRTHADPWIAFESAAAPGDELAVGDRTFVSGEIPLSEVTVQGDAGAVSLSEESAATLIECGEVRSRVYWLEIEGATPGQVTLVFADEAREPLPLTVTP